MCFRTGACFRKGVRTTAHQRQVWLQQYACLGMVRNEEGARGGHRYGAYLRLRTDMEVFEPLPPAFHVALGPSEAVAPSGDDWGEEPAIGKQVADNAMQVMGGAGYCREFPLERLLRDAKLLEIGGGTLESHQKNLTKDLTRLFAG